MEKTGLPSDAPGFIDAIASSFSVNFAVYVQKELSRLGRQLDNSQNEILNLLKHSNNLRELDLLILTEEFLINSEIGSYAKLDPQILPSLEAALVDFSVIKSSTATVREPEKYQDAETTHHPKKRLQSGVLIDGCHDAVNSHIARLNNRLRSIAPASEKKVTAQRIANTRLIKNLYIELQKKALGIEDRGKGRSR